jgi:hypothetical protein
MKFFELREEGPQPFPLQLMGDRACDKARESSRTHATSEGLRQRATPRGRRTLVNERRRRVGTMRSDAARTGGGAF